MGQVRLLIVDDDPVYIALGAEEMECAGYDVTTAGDGESAYALLLEREFDLLISDYEMPELDGPGLLRRIRDHEDEAIARLPVIMITGRDDTHAVSNAFDQGATSFVQKPVNWLIVRHHTDFVLRASDASKRLREARDLALKASRGKDSLMMALRHELRSPLHVIQGFSSLLRNKASPAIDPDTESALKYIEDGVVDMIDKMDKLFMYSEILNRTLSIGSDEVDLIHLLNRAKERAEQFATGSNARIRIENNVAARVMLNGDEEKLLVGFEHLLDNALKFSPPGGEVKLEVELDEDSASLCVRISDSGDGFDLERVGEYLSGFGQGDAGLTRESTGVGLGLTVTDYIVHAHRGRMTLGNGENGGGRVEVHLPQTLAAEQTRAA